MAFIKYKGQKKNGIAVSFPIGCKSKGGISHHKTVSHNGTLEMSDEEAMKLVEIDPLNFEIAEASESGDASESSDDDSKGKKSKRHSK